MNIFILDESIETCAKNYVDKHVVKIPLELGQMLSTAHRVLSSNESQINSVFYKKTHVNNRCSKWVRESKGNYDWAYQLFAELCLEYQYRYNKTHLCWIKLKDLLLEPPELINSSTKMTPFALAMPDDCKVSNNAILSYRNYYNKYKRHLFKWKNRNPPSWINKNANL